jgi:hypothetical protein
VQLELGDNTADEKLRLTGAASGKPLMTFYNTTTKIGQISSSSVGMSFTSLGSGDMSVGIGTTGPSYKLDVDGVIRGEQYLRLKDTAGTNQFSIRAESTYGTLDNGSKTFNYIASNHLFLVGVSEKMRINSSGNVGIGTTSPSHPLTIVSSYPQIKIQQTGQTPSFTFGSGSGYAVFDGIGTSGSLLDIRDDGTSRMRIDASGNVGIGTSSPGAKLDVAAGDIRLGTNATYFRVRDTASAQPRVLGMNASNVTYVGPIDSYAGGGIIYGASSNVAYHDFYGGGSTKVRITSTGDVGIGTTSPASQLGSTKVLDISSTGNGEIILDHTDAGVSSDIGLYSWNRNNDHLAHIKASCDGATDSAFISFHTQATGGSFVNAQSNERMRINSSGNVGIGTTSPSSKLHVKDTSLSGTLAYFEASSGAQGATNVRVDCLQYGTGIAFFRDGFVGGGACSFRNDSGTQVGSITIGTSSTAYNTSSDYRLKENLTLITDGIDRLKQLKPKRFNFIGETQTVDGFIAHEAKEVVPESVTGEKDAVLLNGNPIYQGIDQAKIVPLLTAALQEAVAKIEDLENRIQTLENK